MVGKRLGGVCRQAQGLCGLAGQGLESAIQAGWRGGAWERLGQTGPGGRATARGFM